MSENIYPDHLPQEEEAFAVVDQQTAEWTVRKIGEHRKKQAEIKELADAEITRIIEWAEKQTKQHENSVEYLQGVLRPWFEEQGEKSISLPSGRIRFRKLPDKFKWKDEQAVISWAKINHPKAIRTKEELDKKEIASYIKQTGEMPDGVEIEKPEPIFEVKPE